MATIRKRTLNSGKISWLACYRDGEGKRRFKSFKTKRDADAYLHSTVVAVAGGIHVAPSQSITIKQASELWLKNAAADGLRWSTQRQYRGHVDLHIVPGLGPVKLAELSKAQVSAFVDDRKAHASLAMARKLKTSLTSILGFAHDRGLVAQNVASGVPPAMCLISITGPSKWSPIACPNPSSGP